MHILKKGDIMASWDEILKELGETPSQVDYVRRKYIKELSDFTGRNTIIYYSGFLQRKDQPNLGNIDVNDQDMEGFMATVRGLDCSKGLDLIMHTPGGDPNAAEAIVNYLKDKFNNDIRVIVPQISMSAGTMMACCAREILMGKQSSLGPIDPQFNGIPAYNILHEYEEAKEDLSANPDRVQYWAIKLQQYPAAFMKTCIDAIDLSSELVRKWLSDNMLKDSLDKVEGIVKYLNDHGTSKSHARHFNYLTCKEIGLNITLLESDQKLQDSVLSVHHASMLTFDRTPAAKIIENHKGQAFINTVPII